MRLAGAGVQTLALAFGGLNPTPANTGVTEEWNGTSWTEVNDLNTARSEQGGVGIQTSALCIGGLQAPAPLQLGNTEHYNGTSWSELNDLATFRSALSSAGTATLALAFGGYNGTVAVANTEEWAAATTNNTLTAS